MKPINVYFEDSEMEVLKKVKGEETWHNCILEWAKLIERERQVDKRK